MPILSPHVRRILDDKQVNDAINKLLDPISEATATNASTPRERELTVEDSESKNSRHVVIRRVST